MRRCAAPRRPTALSFISTMSRIIVSGSSVCSRSGNATFSNTRQVGEQRAELEQHAQAAPQPIELLAVARVDGLAVEADLAALVAGCTPPIRRSSVVLPQPEPPRMAVTLPRSNVKLTSFRIVRLAS